MGRASFPTALVLSGVVWMGCGASGNPNECLSDQQCSDNKYCVAEPFVVGECVETCRRFDPSAASDRGAGERCDFDFRCLSGRCDNDTLGAPCTCQPEGTGGGGGTGGAGGSDGTRTVADRCMESTKVYCDNGYDCQGTWSVSDQDFRDLYGQNKNECLATGIPCTTEEAYCPDRGFPGTYNAANHEACIDGQKNTNCAVDDLNLPVFPPECDEICVE